MVVLRDPLRRSRRILYYAREALALLVPPALSRASMSVWLARVTPEIVARSRERADYCAALPLDSKLGAESLAIGSFDDRQRWTYYFDLRRTLVRFDPRLRFHWFPGDANFIPAHPTLTKCRPLAGGAGRSVILKLNRIRHFHFVRDRIPFSAKQRRVVWRGNARYAPRREVLERYSAHPRCDLGHVGRAAMPAHLTKPWMPIRAQLGYRYVLNLEGNDVATSLKWSMASQSLCLMPKPRFETWFMEGRLVPGVHYVQLEDDCSDLEEKLDHYDAHEEEALRIVRNANAYAGQFQDALVERLTETLAAARYFERTGQSELLPRSLREMLSAEHD